MQFIDFVETFIKCQNCTMMIDTRLENSAICSNCRVKISSKKKRRAVKSEVDNIKIERILQMQSCCNICKLVFLKSKNGIGFDVAYSLENVQLEQLELRNLEFDHLPENETSDFKEKISGVAQCTSSKSARVEAEKCQLICLYCHVLVTKFRNDSVSKLQNKPSIILKRNYVNNIKRAIGRCTICNFFCNENLSYFEFDHLNPNLKSKNISTMVGRTYTLHDIDKEIQKCRLLCKFCHRLHSQNQAIERFANMKNSEENSLSEVLLLEDMRFSTLKNKIAINDLRLKDIESIYTRICADIRNGNWQVIMSHLIGVYKTKMEKYISERSDLNEAHYTLTIMQERYISLVHTMTETVIYAYGGLKGGLESNMYCYHDKTGHVQTRSYKFWNDQGLQRLLVSPPASVGETTAIVEWHLLYGDALRYMTKYLPAKDLLACTSVCAAWRRNLMHDSVWRPRLGGLMQHGHLLNCGQGVFFKQFICSFALLADLEPTTVETCLVKNMQDGLAVLSNICAAWRYKNRIFLSYDAEIMDECIVETYPSFAQREVAEEDNKAVFAPLRGGEVKGVTKKRLSILVEMDEARKKLKMINARVKRINTIRRFIDNTAMDHSAWRNRAKTDYVNAFMAGMFKNNGEEGALVWITGDGKLKLANLKNAKGCETGDNVKEVLHNMMLEYADSLYF